MDKMQIWMWIILMIFANSVAPVWASENDACSRYAIQWINNTQNSDGSWSDSPVSPLKTLHEVLEIARVDISDTTKQRMEEWLKYEENYITSETDGTQVMVGYKNREISFIPGRIAKVSITDSDLSFVSSLIDENGGVGLSEWWGSEVLSTAISLRWLLYSHNSNAVEISRMRDFLLYSLKDDGVWEVYEQPCVYIQSQVILALLEYEDKYPDISVRLALAKGVEYLVCNANADGSIGNSDNDSMRLINTALAVQALLKARVNVAGAAEAITQGLNYLRAHQLPNGSWGNDAYQTALAIQALELAYPDLAVSADRMKVEPASPRVGDTVVISAEVANAGGMATDSATQQLRIIAGGVGGGAEVMTQTLIVPPLAVGEATIITTSWAVSDLGEYEARIEISYDGDGNAANNSAMKMISTTAPADLLISQLIFADSQGEAFTGEILSGQEMRIAATVMNSGGVEARNVVVRCYDGEPGAGGTAIGVSGFVPLLPAGGTATLTFDWTATGGEHQIVAVADPGEQISEWREDNNRREITANVTALPDLTFEPAVSVVPYESNAGEAVEVRVFVRNIGSEGSEATSIIAYSAPTHLPERLLTEPPLPSPAGAGEGENLAGEGEILWAGSVGVLASGAGETITIPVTTDSKGIVVVIDGQKLISEEREDNNLIVVGLRERVGADLRAYLNNTVTTAREGIAINITAIVDNGGDFNSDGGEIIFAADGVEIGRQNITALYPGQRIGIKQEWVAEYGAHNLTATVQSVGDVNVGNNSVSQTVTVSGRADLTANEIALVPAVGLGEATQVMGTITNTGHLGAGGFGVALYCRDAARGVTPQLIATKTITYLAAGEATAITAPWTVTTGNYRFTLVVDTANTVDEISELNNECVWDFSAQGQIFGPPLPPKGLQGVGGSSFALLRWQANYEPDLVGYRGYAGGVQIAQVAGTGYTDTGIPASARQYTITAVDNEGLESAHSDQITVYPGPARAELAWRGALTLDQSSPVVGQTVTAFGTIENRGSLAATGFVVALRANSTTGEELGRVSVGRLEPMASKTITANFSAALGQTVIFAVADPGNYVAEADENNNIATSGITVRRRADLVVPEHLVRMSTTDADAGNDITISVTINNRGEDQSKPCKVAIVRAADNAVLAAPRDLPAMTAGMDWTIGNIAITPELGANRLRVIVDYAQEVVEQNEENNSAEVAFDFMPKAENTDIEVVSFAAQPEAFETGEPVQLTATLRNNGATTATAVFVIWRGARVYGDKAQAMTVTLLPGETIERMFSEAVDQPGQHQYTACLDPQNVLYETNEANNEKTATCLAQFAVRAATLVSTTIRRANVNGTVFAALQNSVNKPLGWEITNPLPAAEANPASSAYWELDLDAVDAADLAQYDILALNYSGSLRLTDRERELLADYVANGGKLWVDDQGYMRLANFFAPFSLFTQTNMDIGQKHVTTTAHPVIDGVYRSNSSMTAINPGEYSVGFLGAIYAGKGIMTDAIGDYDQGIYRILMEYDDGNGACVLAGRWGDGKIVVTTFQAGWSATRGDQGDQYFCYNVLGWGDEPKVVVTPTALTFNVRPGVPATQILSITNCGQTTLENVSLKVDWIPAFAGMTEETSTAGISDEGGGPTGETDWIPAFAGMTEGAEAGQGLALGVSSWTVLAAGKTETCVVQAQALPGMGYEPLTYNVAVNVDGRELMTVPVTVQVMSPDLIPDSFVVNSGTLGEVRVRITEKNSGNDTAAAHRVAISVRGSNGTTVHTQEIAGAALAAGANSEYAVTLPLTAGHYTITANCDPYGAIAETERDNNRNAWPLDISSPAAAYQLTVSATQTGGSVQVTAGGQITSAQSEPIIGEYRMLLIDAAGAPVATLGAGLVTLASDGAMQSVASDTLITGLMPGDYRVVLTMLVAGQEIGATSSGVSVAAYRVPRVFVTTDRMQYHEGNTVGIRCRVENDSSANASVTPELACTVRTAAGQTVYQVTRQLAAIPPGGRVEYNEYWPANVTSGDYIVEISYGTLSDTAEFAVIFEPLVVTAANLTVKPTLMLTGTTQTNARVILKNSSVESINGLNCAVEVLSLNGAEKWRTEWSETIPAQRQVIRDITLDLTGITGAGDFLVRLIGTVGSDSAVLAGGGFSLREDTTAPVTTVTVNGVTDTTSTITVNSDAMIGLTATDPGLVPSGVRVTRYRLQGGDWQYYQQPFRLEGLVAGNYILEFNSTDQRGNAEISQTRIINFTPNRPVIVINSPLDGDVLADNLVLHGSITGLALDSYCVVAQQLVRRAVGEPGITVVYQQTGGADNVIATIATNDWPDGVYEFTVAASGAEGYAERKFVLSRGRIIYKRRLASDILAGTYGCRIATNADGHIFYVEGSTKNLVELLPSGEPVRRIATAGPGGIAISPVNGDIYLTYEHLFVVHHLDAQGRFLGQFGGQGDEDGHFNSMISNVATDPVTGQTTYASSSVGGPEDIAFGPDGNLYVTTEGPRELIVYHATNNARPVQVFTPAGEFVRAYRAPRLVNANSMLINDDGSIMVTNSNSFLILGDLLGLTKTIVNEVAIWSFDRTGTPRIMENLATPDLAWNLAPIPWDIEQDARGYTYVTDLKNGIRVYDEKMGYQGDLQIGNATWLAISDTKLYADVGGLCEYELQNMPTAIIAEPANAARVLAEVITIRGSAHDMRFDSFVLDCQYTSDDGHWELINVGTSAVMDGVLGQWHTNTLQPGFYTLRLRTFTADGFVATAECVVSKGRLQYLGALNEGGTAKAVAEFGLICDVQAGADGRIYITDEQRGAVQIFDTQWQWCNAVTGLDHPLAATASADGAIYVLEQRLQQVKVFASNGELQASFDCIAGRERGNYFSPVSLTLGPDGNLHIGTAGYNGEARVNVLTRSGEFVSRTEPGFNGSRKVSFDPAGRRYYSDGYSSAGFNGWGLTVTDASGALIMETGASFFAGAGPGVSTGCDTAIFVPTNGRLDIYNAQGALLAGLGSYGDRAGQFGVSGSRGSACLANGTVLIGDHLSTAKGRVQVFRLHEIPTAHLSAPALGTRLTEAEVAVIGEVRGEELAGWVVEWRRSGTTVWTTIANGAGAQSGTLGMWQTAGLPDGHYEVRLTVTGNDGWRASDNTVVSKGRIAYLGSIGEIIEQNSNYSNRFTAGVIIGLAPDSSVVILEQGGARRVMLWQSGETFSVLPIASPVGCPGMLDTRGWLWIINYTAGMVQALADSEVKIQWLNPDIGRLGCILATSDRVYLGGRDGVSAYDRTGRLLWQRGQQWVYRLKPAPRGGVIAMGDYRTWMEYSANGEALPLLPTTNISLLDHGLLWINQQDSVVFNLSRGVRDYGQFPIVSDLVEQDDCFWVLDESRLLKFNCLPMPTVEILAPLANMPIDTNLEMVRGRLSGEMLAGWEMEYRRLDETQWHGFASGLGGGELSAPWPTADLEPGSYLLRLRGYATDGGHQFTQVQVFSNMPDQRLRLSGVAATPPVSHAYGLALSPSGELYNLAYGQIWVFNKQLERVGTIALPEFGFSMAFAPDGRLFVALSDGRIVAINDDGSCSTVMAGVGMLAFLPDGDLLVANGQRVRRYAAGSYTTLRDEFNHAGGEPVVLTTGPDGTIAIIDAGQGMTELLTDSGQLLAHWRNRYAAYGAAFDEDGRLWVADRGNKRISAYDRVGRHIYYQGEPGNGFGQLNDPRAIAVGSGRVYVADVGNKRLLAYDVADMPEVSLLQPQAGVDPGAGEVVLTAHDYKLRDWTVSYTPISVAGSSVTVAEGTLSCDAETVGLLPLATLADGIYRVTAAMTTSDSAWAVAESVISLGHLQYVTKIGDIYGGTARGQFGAEARLAMEPDGGLMVRDGEPGPGVEWFDRDGKYRASRTITDVFGVATDPAGNRYFGIASSPRTIMMEATNGETTVWQDARISYPIDLCATGQHVFVLYDEHVWVYDEDHQRVTDFWLGGLLGFGAGPEDRLYAAQRGSVGIYDHMGTELGRLNGFAYAVDAAGWEDGTIVVIDNNRRNLSFHKQDGTVLAQWRQGQIVMDGQVESLSADRIWISAWSGNYGVHGFTLCDYDSEPPAFVTVGVVTATPDYLSWSVSAQDNWSSRVRFSVDIFNAQEEIVGQVPATWVWCGEAWQPTVARADLSDGGNSIAYHCRVRCVDGAGNSAETLLQAALAVTLNTPENSLVRGSLPITGSITGGSIQRYECSYEAGSGPTVFATGTSIPPDGIFGTLQTTELNDGLCRITLTAFPESGDPVLATVEVQVDNTAPAITNLIANPATFSPDGNGIDDQTAISFNFTDNYGQYPGSLRVAVRDSGQAVMRELISSDQVAYGSRSNIWDGADAAGIPAIAGEYAVMITGADAAGNQATANIMVRVQYDVTSPLIDIAVPTANAQLSYTQTLTLQWTVSDTESGVASSSAILNGQAVTSGTSVNLLTLGIGSHILAISATDNAGNSATASVAFSVIDDVPPVITLQQPATPTNQDVTLVYTAEDEITPAEQLVITGNNSPYCVEGSHSVSLTATDDAGNSATSNTGTFLIDKTAPVTELTVGLPQYGAYVTPATLLTLTATDNLTSVAVMRYRIDGGDWQDYSGAFTLAGEGSRIVGYASTDIVGNGETEKSISLTVDATAPECVLILEPTDQTGVIVVPETLISLTATDSGAGVAGIEYRINDGGWQAYSAPFEVLQAGITSGQLVIAYRATDNLGNIAAEQSRTVTVKPALELSAGLLNAPRVLAWWNEPVGGQHPSKDASLAALRAVLDSAALNSRIVENAADFKSALTDYNVYLIMGDQATLDDAGESLVAAQVALGKSLVSFGYEDIGTPESSDRGWSNIFGVKVAGVLNGSALLALKQCPLGETQTATVEGQSERITEVLSGEVWGEIALTATGESGHGQGGGHHTDTYPAVVANGWGMGRTLYAVPEYSRNLAGLAGVLRNAVAWAAPAQEVVLPGGSVALRIAVKNAVLPLTLRVNVEALVPTGGDVVAVYDDGEDRGSYVTWFDDLATTATGEYRCVLRLPSELSGCVVRVDAAYLKSGNYRNAGSVSVDVR